MAATKQIFLEVDIKIVKTAALFFKEFFTDVSKDEKLPAKIITPFNTLLEKVLHGDFAINVKWLQQRMAQFFELIKDDILQEKFQQTLNMINYVVNSYNENKTSPIHLAASHNLIHYIPHLIEIGFSIECENNNKYRPLHSAAETGNLEIVTLLIETYKVDIHATTRFGFTACQLAARGGYSAVQNYLQQRVQQQEVKSIDPAQIIAGRRLYCVLGGQKLSKEVKTQGTFIHAELSSSVVEGYEALKYFLTRFAETTQSATQAKLEKIILALTICIDTYKKLFNERKEAKAALEAFQKGKAEMSAYQVDIESSIKELHPGESRFVIAGSLNHLIGVSISKEEDGNYVLTMGERGVYYGRHVDVGGKRCSVESIKFNAKYLHDVVVNLVDTRSLSEKEAERILFEVIPKLVGSSYQENPHIVQSAYKSKICFFGNPKTLIYDEFIKAFGIGEGKKRYKDYTLFMRQAAVEEYEKWVGSEDVYVIAGKKIVAEKIAKQQLLAAVPEIQKWETSKLMF